MQTKQEIRQLLASAGASIKKPLGQHFLIDLNLMRLLVDSADIGSDDVVLEAGCGTGSLTQALAQRAGAVIAVELDRTLAVIAAELLAEARNVQVINTDILEIKSHLNSTVTKAIERAKKKHKGRFLLVANLPYNVASPVMLNLVMGPIMADGMYVTVQKQVAQRMTASPGSSDYGTLSILLGANGEVKIIRTLKPTVFWPPPQVDSAMVGFCREKEKADRIRDMQMFGEVVHFFIQHRRKMLKSCCKLREGKLAGIESWPEIFKQCSIDSTKRPDHLRPEDYVAIANRYHDMFLTTD